MKIRKGFVSNSSSSSFICDVCSEVASGWDLSLEEAEMCECEHNHIFCEDHKVEDVTLNNKREMVLKDDDLGEEEKEKVRKMNDEEFEKYYDVEYSGGRYEIPSAFCPLCQFKDITDRDLSAYLLRKAKNKRKEIIEEIKKRFKNYEDFLVFIKEIEKEKENDS